MFTVSLETSYNSENKRNIDENRAIFNETSTHFAKERQQMNFRKFWVWSGRSACFFSGAVFFARLTLARSAFHIFQIGFKRYKHWNPKLKRGWTNHPEKPDEKTVQTLEVQTEQVKKYFSENMNPAHQHAAEKWAPSDRCHRKSEESWIAATPRAGAALAQIL